MSRFLLDTNAFDLLLDNGITPDAVRECGRIVVTRVQMSELKNVPNHTRRRDLLSYVEAIAPEKLPLDSGIWIDDLHWDDDQPWRDEIGPDCEHFVDGKPSKPWRDALIGEVAKHNDLTLVSQDATFLRDATRIGIATMEVADFLSLARAQVVENRPHTKA